MGCVSKHNPYRGIKNRSLYSLGSDSSLFFFNKLNHLGISVFHSSDVSTQLRQPQIWNSHTTSGPMTEPRRALRVMETELMETESSPYSMAFEVPRAWDALPSAIPCPILLRIRTHLRIIGPRMTPENPATMTKTTVMAGTPPIPEAIWIATGVVIDLGMMERIRS